MRALTEEQHDAVAAFATGRSLKLNAFAGSGKTTTLQAMGQSTHRSGIYLAFNRSIAVEAKSKFPRNVDCRTTHSLAFRSTPTEFRDQADKMTGAINGNAVAIALSLSALRITDGVGLDTRGHGHLVLRSLKNFLNSNRTEVAISDVPIYGAFASLPRWQQQEVQADIAARVRSLWALMRNPLSLVPLGHDGYLKLWAMSGPRLVTDFVLLDEAQDSNPVVLEVLRAQDCQVVYVGDRHQQIYEWRGAVNAMDAIRVDHEGHLTQSFRFGDAIASAASSVLGRLGERLAIRGNPSVASRIGCGSPSAILCRTNAEVASQLVSAQKHGFQVHIVGGPEELVRLLRAVAELKQNQPTNVPEFFGFGSWNEVLEFAATPEGEHLKTFVRLVESHGERALLTALGKTISEEKPGVLVLSTAHKAKGREWNRVELMEDFFRPSRDEDGNPQPLPSEELRLLYVAMTRAKNEVQLPDSVAALLELQQSPRTAMEQRPKKVAHESERANSQPHRRAKSARGQRAHESASGRNSNSRIKPRPYFQCSIEELQGLAEQSWHGRAELKRVRDELKHRSTGSAKRLLSRVQERMGELAQGG